MFFLHITCSLAQLEEDRFKIGILVPLSGLATEYGFAIKNGVSLALEDNKEKLNFCEFVYEDTEYNSLKTVTAFHRLAGSGINLIYAFGGPMSEVLAPLAEAKKIPLMCDSIDTGIPIGKDYVVRNHNTGLEYGGALSKHLISKGSKRIAIVKTENQYLNALADGFLESAAGQFEVVDFINVLPEDSDFKPILPKLLKGNFDAIGFFLFPAQSSTLSRLLMGYKESYIFFGSGFLESKQQVESSLGVLEGAVYPNNVVSNQFRERYVSRFKNDSQIRFAGEGYDVVSLIIDSICSRGSVPSGEETMKLLKSVKVREGVLGRTEYVETEAGDKYFKAPVYVMRASVDGFKPVE